MSCHFCRACAPFYALRGVMGSLGAEIPAGFYGVAETRSSAEGSAARARLPCGCGYASKPRIVCRERGSRLA